MGTNATKIARFQKTERLVSTVRCRTSVSGAIRSLTMSLRRMMLRIPRASSMATTAYTSDHARPNWRAMYATAKAEAPTNSVKIQKMITAGSTHYTGWGCNGDEHGDGEADRHQDVTRAVHLGKGIEPDPVGEQIQPGAVTHHHVLTDRAFADQRRGELRGDRHPRPIGQDHQEVEGGPHADQPDAHEALSLPDRPDDDPHQRQRIDVLRPLDVFEGGDEHGFPNDDHRHH